MLIWLIMSKPPPSDYITKADLDEAVKIILNHMKRLFEKFRTEIRGG